MNQVGPLIDHAAAQSDRWLFLFLLALILCGGLLVIRYLVRRDEAKSKHMHESYDRNTATIMELKVTLSHNKEAFDRNTLALERNTRALEKANH